MNIYHDDNFTQYEKLKNPSGISDYIEACKNLSVMPFTGDGKNINENLLFRVDEETRFRVFMDLKSMKIVRFEASKSLDRLKSRYLRL